MPYIKQAERNEIDFELLETPGQLNYVFTKIALAYLKYNKETYQTYNDIVGALEGAKLELYRRKVSLYEDKKIQENGDVE